MTDEGTVTVTVDTCWKVQINRERKAMRLAFDRAVIGAVELTPEQARSMANGLLEAAAVVEGGEIERCQQFRPHRHDAQPLGDWRCCWCGRRYDEHP